MDRLQINRLVDNYLEALDFPSVDLTLKHDGLLLSFHAEAFSPESFAIPSQLRQDDRELLLLSYNDAMSVLSQKSYRVLCEFHSEFQKCISEALKNRQCSSETINLYEPNDRVEGRGGEG